jgi:hypothetical protein
MRRLLITTLLSAAVTLAIGFGGTAAQSAAHHNSSKARTDRHPRRGTIIANLVALSPTERGSVKVLNDVARVVAHRGVRGDAHLRFLLKPGRYKIKFTVQDLGGCFTFTTLHVRARRTTRITLPAPCNTY